MLDSRLPSIPPRNPESHKGDYGNVLVVAGSRGMVGAACLAAVAAQRCGAGKVTLAVPASLQSVAAAKMTSVMTWGLSDTEAGALGLDSVQEILRIASQFQVLAVGPGLGTAPETVSCVRNLVRELDLPLVLDADGINAMLGAVGLLRLRSAPTILTPHPGEYRRLHPEVEIERVGRDGELVRQFASAHGVVLALKGHQTMVSDGTDLYLNETGNAGMATGGTGDVLTGCVAGFIAQGFDPYRATCLAVHLHGLAGDMARDRFGEVSMMAEDVLEYLPAAIVDYQGSNR